MVRKTNRVRGSFAFVPSFLLPLSLGGCEAGRPPVEEGVAPTPEGLSLALESLACSNGSFVLHYGAPDPDNFQRIASLPSKPAFIVVDDYALNTAAVDPSDPAHAPGWFHTHPDPAVQQIRVLKYVPTNHSLSKNVENPACPVLSETPHPLCNNVTLDASCAAVPIETRITRAMDSGFDGVFFDETSTTASIGYVQDCASKVKDVWGDNKLVIINPGVNDPAIYAYYSRKIDIISVERNINPSVAPSGIPAIHWMGVENRLNNEGEAVAQLSQFRANGGFWYYGTERYSELPNDTWLQSITNAAHPGRPDCGCLTPDSRNLLGNPGFDGNLGAWNVDSGTGTFTYAGGADATGCASSGSAYLETPWDGSADMQRIWQCVPVSPNTTYNFGARIFGQGSWAYCNLDLYTGASCSGGPSEAASGLWFNLVWSPDQDAQVTMPSNVVSARVSCHIEGGGAAYFDTLYLSSAPGEY
jgi:hypothetical protein